MGGPTAADHALQRPPGCSVLRVVARREAPRGRPHDHDQRHRAVEGIEEVGEDPFRALEVAGYIGIMLCGAFPMIFLIRRHLARPIGSLGKRVGLSPVGASGLLATVSNILALFRILRDMPPEDKVVNIAFAVSAAFLFGDHLAFTATFQPNLIVAVMTGKIVAGVVGFAIARWIAVPRARALAAAAL